jgi:transposase
VPPKLAARVRLPGSGPADKNDPDDALPVAIAALRSAGCLPVRADDHAAVLTVRAKRYRDLSRSRNQVVCRLHAVLCQLVAGGVSKRITAGQAARILDQVEPRGAAGAARWQLAEQFLTDLRRTGIQRRDIQHKLVVAVRASGTTVTEIFGVGPAVAAAVIGDVGDISRFASKDSFAAYNGTAPAGVSSGNRVACRLSLRGNRRMNHAVHMAAVTQIRYRHTRGRAYYDKKLAEGKTSKEAQRALKRQVNDALYRRLKAGARRAAASIAGPGGHPGTALSPARPACTPQAGSSDKPLPDLTPPYDRIPAAPRPRARAALAGPDARCPHPPSPRVPRCPQAGAACRAPPRAGLGLPAFPALQGPSRLRCQRAAARPSRASAMRSTLYTGGTAPYPARHPRKQRRRSRHLPKALETTNKEESFCSERSLRQ